MFDLLWLVDREHYPSRSFLTVWGGGGCARTRRPQRRRTSWPRIGRCCPITPCSMQARTSTPPTDGGTFRACIVPSHDARIVLGLVSKRPLRRRPRTTARLCCTAWPRLQREHDGLLLRKRQARLRRRPARSGVHKRKLLRQRYARRPSPSRRRLRPTKCRSCCPLASLCQMNA